MYYATNEEPGTQISMRDLLWDLLGQWKAILIVAVVAACAFVGAKYLMDTKAYGEALQLEQAEEAARASMTKEEIVEAALAELPESERTGVEHVLNLQQLAAAQRRYLEESIILSVDGTSQRTLNLRYYLHKEGDADLRPIADSYSQRIQSPESIAAIFGMIDPDLDQRYASEILTVSIGDIPDSAAREVMITVTVTLADNTDAEAVTAEVDNRVNQAHTELGSRIGEHTIERIYQTDTVRYNSSTMDKKLSATNALNTLYNNIRNATSNLNKAQKAVLATIDEAMAEEVEGGDLEGVLTEGGDATADASATSAAQAEGAVDGEEELVKPKPEPLYAALGFVGGAVLYALAYLCIVLLRGALGSAQGLEAYTGCRLLGEVYYREAHSGIAKLFHSRWVEAKRYGGLGSEDDQLIRSATAARSICEHAGTSKVSILSMMGMTQESQAVGEGVVSALRDQGLSVEVIDLASSIEESSLLPVTEAIYLVDGQTKASEVWKLSLLCRDYDVRTLGCFYVCAQ